MTLIIQLSIDMLAPILYQIHFKSLKCNQGTKIMVTKIKTESVWGYSSGLVKFLDQF
jgi:hypothetical protein